MANYSACGIVAPKLNDENWSTAWAEMTMHSFPAMRTTGHLLTCLWQGGILSIVSSIAASDYWSIVVSASQLWFWQNQAHPINPVCIWINSCCRPDQDGGQGPSGGGILPSEEAARDPSSPGPRQRSREGYRWWKIVRFVGIWTTWGRRLGCCVS
jgi:hypothetical protein